MQFTGHVSREVLCPPPARTASLPSSDSIPAAAPSFPGELCRRPPRRPRRKSERLAEARWEPAESAEAARGAATPRPCQGGSRAAGAGRPEGNSPHRRSARRAAHGPLGRHDAGRRLTLGERVQHPRLLQVPAELLPFGVRGLREDAHTVRSAAPPPQLRRRLVVPGRPPPPPRRRHEGPSQRQSAACPSAQTAR